MKDAWKIVPLEKVLRYRKEFIHISDLEKYKRCRVQCHVQGIVLRDLVEGTQIRTKNQQICKEGDFLVAEIDAKLGGFGIVPEELEGAIVSSHYYLYEIDEDLLDRSFFSFFIRTPYFRDQVSSQAPPITQQSATTMFWAIRCPCPRSQNNGKLSPALRN